MVFMMISIPCLALQLTNMNVSYLYTDHSEHREVLIQYYEAPVVVISQRGWHVEYIYWQFFEFKNDILFATSDCVDLEQIGNKSFDGGLILLFPNAERTPENLTLEDIIAVSGLNNATQLLQLDVHDVYYLE